MLDKDRFGAESLERPALVRTADGGWRLYVCCATPRSAHWRIEALDASVLHALADAPPATVFTGDERTGVKDPVVPAITPDAGRRGSAVTRSNSPATRTA